MALRLLAVTVAALALVAPAAAATQKRANACLKAHHVVTKPVAKTTITRFGVRVLALESFSFLGKPAKVFDNGTLIFERNATTARQAQRTLYSRLAIYEIKHSNGSVGPYTIRLNLRRTESVIANVVVIWNNYPQHAKAKSILAGCLR